MDFSPRMQSGLVSVERSNTPCQGVLMDKEYLIPYDYDYEYSNTVSYR